MKHGGHGCKLNRNLHSFKTLHQTVLSGSVNTNGLYLNVLQTFYGSVIFRSLQTVQETIQDCQVGMGCSSTDPSRLRNRHEYMAASNCLVHIIAVSSTGRTDGWNLFGLYGDAWTKQNEEGQTRFWIRVGGNVEEDACVQGLTDVWQAGSKLSNSMAYSCTPELVVWWPCFSRGHLEGEA